MAVYKIADILVEYDCKFDTLKNRSEKYRASKASQPTEILKITDDYLKSRRAKFPCASDETLEYMGIGTAFHKILLKHSGMMLHSSAVALDGRAYLFSAPSGVGKSTHTALWQQLFGEDRAIIINDDKPAIRKIGGVYHAFGTPFSGKFDINANLSFPIQGICFIERSKKNYIEKMSANQAIAPLFDQTIRPKEPEKMDLLCKRVDDLLSNISFYKMGCSESLQAAEMAYKAMRE